MKTTLRYGVEKKTIYSLLDIENKDEMLMLIEEFESELKSCPFCGNLKPAIMYSYSPEREINHHQFYVWCSAERNEDGRSGCWIRTIPWGAADDEDGTDIKHALYMISQMWNRRVDD
jgi:hypothetical protein